MHTCVSQRLGCASVRGRWKCVTFPTCERQPAEEHLSPASTPRRPPNQHRQTSLCVCGCLLKPEVTVGVQDVYFSGAVGILLQSVLVRNLHNSFICVSTDTHTHTCAYTKKRRKDTYATLLLQFLTGTHVSIAVIPSSWTGDLTILKEHTIGLRQLNDCLCRRMSSGIQGCHDVWPGAAPLAINWTSTLLTVLRMFST